MPVKECKVIVYRVYNLEDEVNFRYPESSKEIDDKFELSARKGKIFGPYDKSQHYFVLGNTLWVKCGSGETPEPQKDITSLMIDDNNIEKDINNRESEFGEVILFIDGVPYKKYQEIYDDVEVEIIDSETFKNVALKTIESRYKSKMKDEIERTVAETEEKTRRRMKKEISPLVKTLELGLSRVRLELEKFKADMNRIKSSENYNNSSLPQRIDDIPTVENIVYEEPVSEDVEEVVLQSYSKKPNTKEIPDGFFDDLEE